MKRISERGRHLGGVKRKLSNGCTLHEYEDCFVVTDRNGRNIGQCRTEIEAEVIADEQGPEKTTDESSATVELVPKFLNICITDAYDESAEYLVNQYKEAMSRYYTNKRIPDAEWQDMKDELQFFTVFVKGEDTEGEKFCVCAFLLADEGGIVGVDYSTHTSEAEFDYFEDDIVKIVQSPRMHRQPSNFAVCFDDYGQWKRFVQLPSPVNASKDQSKLKEWYNYGEPWNSNPLKPMVAESTGSEGSDTPRRFNINIHEEINMKTRKRIVKEGFYKGEIASRSMDKLASIEGDLVSICNDIKLVFGKDSDVFARVDLLRTDCGKALDLLDNALKGMKYDEPVKLSESGDDSGWFDARGDLLKPLPGACIVACASQGRVDDQVAYWVDELGFDIDLPRDKAIKFLSEYGAWEPDELENMDIIELAEKVLWIFCNDLKEQAYDMVGEDEELAAELGDDPSEWEDKEWKQFQNEYGLCTLCH